MPESIIAYDKDLPEIPGRCSWIRPTSYLIRNPKNPISWTVIEDKRRPTKLLLVTKLREAVDQWREAGYPGASDVTKRLFSFWFEEDHEISGFPVPFRYHFCQREAIETLAYLIEVEKNHDAKALIEHFGKIFKKGLFDNNIQFQTTMEGKRQINRFFPEKESVGIQDLPPENLRRYAFKMATGTGKTWVMAMAIVWSYFHKRMVSGSELSTNFLVVAPNVIVYQRLEKDFASNRIFHQIPLIPPEWSGQWNLKIILRGENAEANPSGNLVLTNIQQIYEARDQDWTPANAVEVLLGKRPKDNLSSYQRSLLERLKELEDLVIINDEAHHVHDEDLAWSQSLLGIHRALPKGLTLWLDFSATPKDQGGMFFSWAICDYPLAQAVEDRIVKAPIIVTKDADVKQPPTDPDNVTKENVTEKFGYWIYAAIQRWKEHTEIYSQLGTRPVLFIMTEKNVYADAIGQYLWQTQEFGLRESEVLVIHTDKNGEIKKTDLDAAREAARDIDNPKSRIKAIVSVMMLREGWDVRNVSVVLGLRPFTARAKILPEQVIGRGLRLMYGVSPDRTQTLEVLGTRNLLKHLREQLEVEGVGIAAVKNDPEKPVIIEAVKEKQAYDIEIPIPKPILVHNIKKVSSIDPLTLGPIFEQEELEEKFQIILKMEFATTKTPIGKKELEIHDIPLIQEILSSLTGKVIQKAKLPNIFSELYPIVRSYVKNRCFGKEVDIDTEVIRSHLHRVEIQEAIANYLARKIGELTIDKKTIEFEKIQYKLSNTKPFSWRRNLPPLQAKKTIFNYVATYNHFEKRFAQFLDDVTDVVRFASLGTTEQGESGSEFKVDYLKPSGAIGFYHPDWVIVYQQGEVEINYIIETKGRIWEGTEAKDEAIRQWCVHMSQKTGKSWKFGRINQIDFDTTKIRAFSDIIRIMK